MIVLPCLFNILLVFRIALPSSSYEFDKLRVTRRNLQDTISESKLVLLSSFDYYNEVCKSQCIGESLGGNFSINPCPKCSNNYSHENCNHW